MHPTNRAGRSRPRTSPSPHRSSTAGSRKRRIARLLLLLVLLTGIIGGFLAPLLTSRPAGASSPAPAAPVQLIGADTLDDLRAAALPVATAHLQAGCAISTDGLVAMALAPALLETGAAWSGQAPAPMTLSRYDNQAALYHHGNPNGPFRNAFWHPGVGMWQFDNAGHWGLDAAQRIDTAKIAQVAVTTIADRYCGGGGYRGAWMPWYACDANKQAPGNDTLACMSLFNQIHHNGTLVNVVAVPEVSRTGGMEQRECTNGSGTFPCWRVDFRASTGQPMWRDPSKGRSPIAGPFYVWNDGTNEHRVWMQADTGWPHSIEAVKPLTADPRDHSIAWYDGVAFCDLTTRTGDCPPPPPPPPPAEPEPEAATTFPPPGVVKLEQLDQATAPRAVGAATGPVTITADTGTSGLALVGRWMAILMALLAWAAVTVTAHERIRATRP